MTTANIGDVDKITCPKSVCVMMEKRFPGPTGWTKRTTSTQILENSPFTYAPAQLEEFAANTLDQGDNFRRKREMSPALA
jgi:hypothetical protein